MLFRTSIKCPPREEPDESDRPRRDESRAPAVPDRYYRNDEWRDKRADVCARVEDSGGEGALFFRKPLGNGFDRGWKVSRFAKTEEETRDAEAKHGMGQCVTHRCDTPEDDCE